MPEMPRLWLLDVLIDGRRLEMPPFSETTATRSKPMTTLRYAARRQLEEFLTALFQPDELIEIRFIESWAFRGRKKSRVARSAQWLRRDELISQHDEIADFARKKRANIYFGVCPRSHKGDSDDQAIETVRCVWCDIDDVTVDQADARFNEADIPMPSIVVNSGSGVHAYWLLEAELKSPATRSRIAVMLPYFYRSFGGDHVHNLSRVLRLPGTLNYKDARNGRPPLPCTLCSCDARRRYSLETFCHWIELAESEPQVTPPGQRSGAQDTPSPDEFLAGRAEAVELASRLDRRSPDRSRRDFAIVCDLLRLGLAKEDIWELVSGRSKFESNGRSYFDVTISNAERRILLDGTAPSQRSVPS
jgi:hypothetical protein